VDDRPYRAVGLSSRFNSRTRATGSPTPGNRLTSRRNTASHPPHDADLIKPDFGPHKARLSSSIPAPALVTAHRTTATVRHMGALPNYPLMDQAPPTAALTWLSSSSGSLARSGPIPPLRAA
jgi:hypothetical protein